jgi:hypothetical protein
MICYFKNYLLDLNSLCQTHIHFNPDLNHTLFVKTRILSEFFVILLNVNNRKNQS